MEPSTPQSVALLIVDISSLDSFTDLKGVYAGEELSYVLLDAILKHDGPVLLTDQEWEDMGRVSRPRRDLVEGLKSREDIVRLHFDEDVQDWGKAMRDLGSLLRNLQVARVILGGLWATPDDSSGGVNEAKRLLQHQGFACSIDFSLCGMEED